MPLDIVEFVRSVYETKDFIPLHAPAFKGNEKKYLMETIDSTFVSSVGKFVDQFEEQVQGYTGACRAVATVNGTAALHTGLYLAGVEAGDLVITQALTFVATCNVIYHLGASPVFVDVEKSSLSLCPEATDAWLQANASVDDKGVCRHKETSARVKAILPMHTFGHPARMDELLAVSRKWNIPLVEDAAESLGSYYKGVHTGTIGQYGALSFNGNKVITSGAGGMLLCSGEEAGKRAKHVTTTAKVPHAYEFYHDEPGFNYRMPNLNAALACAQMERLEAVIENKRALAEKYETFFQDSEYQFVKEPEYARSNYWLNAVVCPDQDSRNHLLETTNNQGVMTRPVWQLMHRLPMFSGAIKGDLSCSEWAEAHLVNLPSSPTG